MESAPMPPRPLHSSAARCLSAPRWASAMPPTAAPWAAEGSSPVRRSACARTPAPRNSVSTRCFLAARLSILAWATGRRAPRPCVSCP
eukprot:7717364-Pyramimonas_sp.AAC.1